MAEPTTQQTGVAQAPPSIESRLTAFLDRPQEPADASEGEDAEQEAQPQANAAPETGSATEAELTAEDLPDESAAAPAPGAADAFEIVHNGQQHRLSREETIRLAQQGFDYTQKTQQLAETARQVQERFQRIAQVEQVVPQLQQAEGAVMAIAAQLQPYGQVDWVKLATDDPLEYPKHRARYDALVQSYQAAAAQRDQIKGAIAQNVQALSSQQLQAETQQLLERIPEWKDPEKYKSGAAELRTWLLSQGAAPEEVDGLSSAVAVSIARKAMLYDKLLKAKSEKVKQLRTAPPVTRPGAAADSGSAKADAEQKAHARLKRTGDIKDAAALLMTRLK